MLKYLLKQLSIMSKFYCLPMTAATKNLHIGNLYSWLLADTYRRALNITGVDVKIMESWNCFSEKLEKEVSSKFPHLDKDGINKKCRESIDQNILNAREILSNYDIKFSLPAIRDDSQEYKEIVIAHYENGKYTGSINNFSLSLPVFRDVLNKAKNINFYPSTSINLLNGMSTLMETKSIYLLRNGSYGITIKGVEGLVLGQRYVQSLLPNFYKYYLDIPETSICGKDVLAKSIYFMVANSSHKPFNNLGVHGLISQENKGKISKYKENISLLSDIHSHPDNVRLSLLRQSFGMDFNLPDFESEEKFRRKVENCLIFLLRKSEPVKGKKDEINLPETTSLEKKIIGKIINFNFSGSYQDFKTLVYNDVSTIIIPLIRNNIISENMLSGFISKFMNISKVFVPITIKNIHKK